MTSEAAAPDLAAQFPTYLVLLIEMAMQTPAAQHVDDPRAAARLDIAIGQLLVDESPSVPELVQQVLSLTPDSAYAYTVWGLALAKRGAYEKALIAFDVAVDLDPRFLLALCGKITLMTRVDRSRAVAQEIALLRQQIWPLNSDQAKPFVQLLLALGEPPANEDRYVNIGGGPNFNFQHWRNLEAVPSPVNPDPMRFDPDCEFPLADNTVELVYTSHCLEHLDDATVARVLEEARRVLKTDGALLIKIPDFGRLLRDWRANDPALICAPIWDIESLLPMWVKRGVADTLDNRAAVIFSGFWNDAYGDDDSHFSGEGERGPDAYLGPPVLPQEALRELIEGSTPHQIASALRQHVIDKEPSYHFSHQNAWSEDELSELLAGHGFDVLSFDRTRVVSRYHWVPLVDDMNVMSMYCLAVPAESL